MQVLTQDTDVTVQLDDFNNSSQNNVYISFYDFLMGSDSSDDYYCDCRSCDCLNYDVPFWMEGTYC